MAHLATFLSSQNPPSLHLLYSYQNTLINTSVRAIIPSRKGGLKMAEEEEVAAAIEVFKKANCPGIVAFTEMLLEEKKEGNKRLRTSMTLKNNPWNSLILG